MKRKRINVLNLEAAQLDSYRNALTQLKCDAARYLSDFVEFHGSMHRKGIHGGELFLPWHREFLNFFEAALEARGSQIGIPYWDWLGWDLQPESIPNCFRSQESVQGMCSEVNGNPLWMDRFPHYPGKCGHACLPIPTPQGWNEVLADLRTFAEFGGTQSPGVLERIHNRIHHRSGKYMVSVPTSVVDPLFWSVHSNVDRLWREAQTKNPLFSPPAHLSGRSLPGLNLGNREITVQEVEESSRQLYEYIDRSFRLPIAAEQGRTVLSSKLLSFLKPPYRAIRLTLAGVAIDSEMLELNVVVPENHIFLSVPFFASPHDHNHSHHGRDTNEVAVLLTSYELAQMSANLSPTEYLRLDATRLDGSSHPLEVADNAHLVVDVMM